MIVDIHTHSKLKTEFVSVTNFTFREIKNYISTNENDFYSLGFHPWNLDEFSDETFQQLENLATNPHMIFIGECGLDKNSHFDLDYQKDILKKQIFLSEKKAKPLIFHCVGYFNELIALKKEIKPTQCWIIHGFRGKPPLAAQLIKAGFSISFGEHFNLESVRETPLNKLFIETDESQIPVLDIYNQIANIKSCKVGDLNAGSLLIDSIKTKF